MFSDPYFEEKLKDILMTNLYIQLKDVYEDLNDIYLKKQQPEKIITLLDEGLKIAKSFDDNIDALNAYGRFLTSSNINILLLWEDQKKMMKRGKNSLKSSSK